MLIAAHERHRPIVLHLSHDDHLGADCAFPMELIPLTLASLVKWHATSANLANLDKHLEAARAAIARATT